MHSKVLDSHGEKTYVLVFDKGDEVVTGLTAFAREQQLTAAHFTAIGAFSELTLGFFDRERKDYQKIPVREQVEVLSLVGDVALQDGTPKIHAHVVVGKRDGTAHGGHLLDGRVWPTLELVLSAAPRFLRRRTDSESGLALIDLRAPAGETVPRASTASR
jgi:uncharacterized protein